MADPNDFRPGDLSNNILRKILGRLGGAATDAALISSAALTASTLVETQGVTSALLAQANSVIASTSATTAATLVTTQATTAALLLASNATIAALLAQTSAASPVTNPEFQSSLFGEVNGRVATSFNIRGRRAGFNTINVTQDVGEFLGTTIDLFPELTGAESLQIVSSSASDAAAGVGTRTVKVTYIDTSNALVQSADIVLAGTTPVAAGFFARAIMWMEATSGGTSETSVGNIILRIVGPGATQEQISAGENRSLSARFMVPSGFTGYVAYWQSSAFGGATQDVRLRGTVDGFTRALGTRYVAQDLAFTSDNVSLTNALPWLRFPALSRIKVSTIPSGAAATNRVGTDFTIILVAD